MKTLIKNWNNTEKLIIIYEGEGKDAITIKSDLNEGLDRELTISFVDEINDIKVDQLIKQLGRREKFIVEEGDFILKDNKTFNLLKI